MTKRTAYTYDGSDHVLTLTAVLPAGAFQTTQYVYGASQGRGDAIDSNDVLVATRYPDLSTGSASGSQEEDYTTEAAGERTSYTDRNGSTHTYSYDVLGRLAADTVTTLASGIDGAVQRIGYAYDAQGNVATVTSYADTAGTVIANQVQRTYNGLGQVTAEYQAHAGAVDTSTTPAVRYAYSEMAGGGNNSRLTAMTYPNGRAVSYNYASGSNDAISRLSSMSDSSATLESYKYLGLSTVVERDHPQNGINLAYTGTGTGDGGDKYTGLDRFGRVINQKWINAGGTVVDGYTYVYDRDGNVTAKANTLNSALSEIYTYDGLNRLTSDTRNGSAYQSWNLDALGNMNSVTTQGTTESRTANGQNELTSSNNLYYVYDKDGNQTFSGLAADFNGDGKVDFNDFLILQNNNGSTGKTHAEGDANGDGSVDFNDFLVLQTENGSSSSATTSRYDAWNRLVSASEGTNGTVSAEALAYDGLNRRIKDDTGDAYFDANWQEIENRNAVGQTTAQYTWSPVYMDAMIERDRDTDSDGVTDERLYATQDANWDVTGLANASGVVVQRFGYDDYGMRQVYTPAWTATTDAYAYQHGFQGSKSDAITGRLNFRNRDLDVDDSRWLTVDPLGYRYSLNRYLADASNPITHIDPDGKAPITSVIYQLTPLDSGSPSGYIGSTFQANLGRIGPGHPYYDLMTDPNYQLTARFGTSDIPQTLSEANNIARSLEQSAIDDVGGINNLLNSINAATLDKAAFTAETFDTTLLNSEYILSAYGESAIDTSMLQGLQTLMGQDTADLQNLYPPDDTWGDIWSAVKDAMGSALNSAKDEATQIKGSATEAVKEAAGCAEGDPGDLEQLEIQIEEAIQSIP